MPPPLDREARLAEALRANLRRRKAQARARAEQATEGSSDGRTALEGARPPGQSPPDPPPDDPPPDDMPKDP